MASAPELQRPSYPCTSRGPPPVKEANSRPTYLGAVFCYIYVTVLAQKQPARIPELMAYAATIATARKSTSSQRGSFYDQNFRQEASCNPSQSWAKIDPSIYSQCFLGMAKSAEGWCHTCQSLDHTSDNCPAGSSASTTRKRPWQTVTKQQGDPSLNMSQVQQE